MLHVNCNGTLLSGSRADTGGFPAGIALRGVVEAEDDGLVQAQRAAFLPCCFQLLRSQLLVDGVHAGDELGIVRRRVRRTITREDRLGRAEQPGGSQRLVPRRVGAG